MGCNRNAKVAEMPVQVDWQILHISRSINQRKAILPYISAMRVSESIQRRFLKKEQI
jgi:hypothetical protein